MARLDRAIRWQSVKDYFVYILASHRRGALYVGVTSDLVRRVAEHRAGSVDGFTRRYAIHQLVHFEATSNVDSAIRRETRLKKWPRAWKVALIEGANPSWRDLFDEVCGLAEPST